MTSREVWVAGRRYEIHWGTPAGACSQCDRYSGTWAPCSEIEPITDKDLLSGATPLRILADRLGAKGLHCERVCMAYDGAMRAWLVMCIEAVPIGKGRGEGNG